MTDQLSAKDWLDQGHGSCLLRDSRAEETGAEVIAVGPGRFNEAGTERIPMDVKAGDKVIYSKYGGTEVKIEGDDYLILSARDVLAIVSK